MPGTATAAGARLAWSCAWAGAGDAWSTLVLAFSELDPCDPDGEDISTEPARRTPEAGSGVGVRVGVCAACVDDPAPTAAAGAAAELVVRAPPAPGSARPTAWLSPLCATARPVLS